MKALSPKQKTFLYQTLVFGRLRGVAKPVYDGLMRVILLANRLRDAFSPKDRADVSDLTVLIKTFERPYALRQLVDSIRRHYPEIKIVVVDDSQQPQPIAGVEYLSMPYDVGISAGRNAGMEKITTSYFLLLDDDFVFSRRQRLGVLLEEMAQYPAIDILGGRCIDLPLYIVHAFHDVQVQSQAEPKTPLGTQFGANRVVDKVQNYFIARTEPVRRVKWNPQLKVQEHSDFFTRARGVLTTAYREDMLILHAKTPFDIAYMARRHRATRR